MRARTYDEFNAEHMELSKMISFIKKGWVIEYYFNDKMVNDVEKPIKLNINLDDGEFGEITFYPIDQEKTITTWVDGNPGASSLFKSSGNYDCIETYVQNEVVTNCHRLDTVMQKYGIPKVDIIWMDIQGAELLALKSLGKYLNYVEYVYTEVTYNSEMYTGQVMFQELHDFMLNNHYIVKNNLSMGQCWQDNVVYKNTKNTYHKEIQDNYDKQGFYFDIVIPVGPNDLDKINRQLEYNKKNVI
jgi:FkbM family methyltransferase